MDTNNAQPANNINEIPHLTIWRDLQLALVLTGLAVVTALLFAPALGLNLFWNLIIPVAPAILVIIPGIWRNICPMATTGLLPRHFGLSKRKIVSEKLHTHFTMIGIIGLLLIVPLRHLSLNNNGPYTAFMLITAAFIALIAGSRYEWRSVWCSALCPIHPVEKLYGTRALNTVDNAHCTNCEQCYSPCADSTKAITPIITNNNASKKQLGLILTGGFFGYVWGWYQVPDYYGPLYLSNIFNAFFWPLAGFALSAWIFLYFYKISTKTTRSFLVRLFATAAVSCYYWYRLPMLFGWSLLPGNGILIDLSNTFPLWFPDILQILTTGFFIWFMMIRKVEKKSWSIRPAYSPSIQAKQRAAT